jgi:hypothetical protein
MPKPVLREPGSMPSMRGIYIVTPVNFKQESVVIVRRSPIKDLGDDRKYEAIFFIISGVALLGFFG